MAVPSIAKLGDIRVERNRCKGVYPKDNFFAVFLSGRVIFLTILPWSEYDFFLERVNQGNISTSNLLATGQINPRKFVWKLKNLAEDQVPALVGAAFLTKRDRNRLRDFMGARIWIESMPTPFTIGLIVQESRRQTRH